MLSCSQIHAKCSAVRNQYTGSVYNESGEKIFTGEVKLENNTRFKTFLNGNFTFEEYIDPTEGLGIFGDRCAYKYESKILVRSAGYKTAYYTVESKRHPITGSLNKINIGKIILQDVK